MTRPPRTVRRAVDRGARALAGRDVESPRFESELLLAHANGVDRLWILAHPDARPSADAVRRFLALIRRRRRREPAAYLLGRREFYSIDFRVGPGVLVPRPETELLVEKAVEWARAKGRPVRALDVGTGSGAIAVAFLVNVPGSRVVAIDRSDIALRYAVGNAREAGVEDRVNFVRADLAYLSRSFAEGSFDVMLANPPYVRSDLVRDETAHEPALALVGDSGEFPNVYRRLIEAYALLRHGGAMFLEVGEGQAATVAELVSHGARFSRVEIANDLAGVPRTIVATGAGE